MDYAIELLEKEKYRLESTVKRHDLMHKNMSEAQLYFRRLTAIKTAIKLIKNKCQR
ncbi:hypothetical protein SAMN05661044_02664 [Olivibacter domesticus]|jgi:hypothetical protein|uniref:Uncharacterized protein n=1 Tax=Olivibacter domesticus TaxID=407022 RepID=A0A1H7QP08_OLID1|nr:hypothetical protein SAMN05661044_02664 [Olivibacter domesticus]